MPVDRMDRFGASVTAIDQRIGDDAVDLLVHLIRNECVNDGTVESGHEDAERRRARPTIS